MPESTRPTHFRRATEAANAIRSRLPTGLGIDVPLIGIICGSGLGGLAETLHPEPRFSIPYTDIPHFPQSTVLGHAGVLMFGLLGSKKTPVVIMNGRMHFYEGHSIQEIALPTRVMKLLGIHTLIATNAAGGLNQEYRVGDIMVLNDHLNLPGLAGSHPLVGPNEEDFGTRFPALSDAYDLSYRKTVHLAYKKLLGVSTTRRLREGVYAFVSGPSFETRAECRMLRTLGADVVGMSTVPEIIVARHCGLRVLAMSLVTNLAVLDPGPRGDSLLVEHTNDDSINHVLEVGKANHLEVLQAGNEAAKDMQELVGQFIDDIASS